MVKNKQKKNNLPREMLSNNMHYRYNIEYFDYVQQADDEEIIKINQNIEKFNFPDEKMFGELESSEDFQQFYLYTGYPGLIMGTGNLHDISKKGAYKLGFSFDYINGLPYLPGSSLKGVLRSIFPQQHKENKEMYEEYLLELIKSCTKTKVEKENLEEIEKELFNYGDVFLGAYPDGSKMQNKQYITTEYITPHHIELKNPNPISFVKVKPNVCFQFSFLVKDGKYLNREEKKTLYKKIIMDIGVGAKTNVGFGKFSDRIVK